MRKKAGPNQNVRPVDPLGDGRGREQSALEAVGPSDPENKGRLSTLLYHLRPADRRLRCEVGASAAVSRGVSGRISPGAKSPKGRLPIETRTRFLTRYPRASHMRRTWRFSPSERAN